MLTKPGLYQGKVTLQEIVAAISTNTPVLSIGFRITCQIKPGGEVQELDEERDIYVRRAITAKTVQYLAADINHLVTTNGGEQVDIDGIESLDPKHDEFSLDLTGFQADLICKHERYKGQKREVWSIRRTRDVDPDAFQGELNDAFRSHLKSIKEAPEEEHIDSENSEQSKETEETAF